MNFIGIRREISAKSGAPVTYLHADDRVDEEQHGNEQTDVGQRLVVEGEVERWH